VSGDTRPAFYALRPGGWRDYWTLLHPPYTVWHLSYVAIGAALAPRVDWAVLGWTLLAFAVLSVAAACAIGVLVASQQTRWLLAFVAAGAFLVVAYNLELLGGAFHSDWWFAAAWGAFPLLTSYFAVAGRLRAEAFLGAAFAFASSLAQRTLSTPVRAARREAGDPAPTRPLEVALQLLAAALPLLAGALLVARAG
jgi:hypothetical protein